MKHLNKEELEKLKVGDILRVSCFTNPFNNKMTLEPDTTTYFIQVIRIKLGRNGYRIRTECDLHPDDSNPDIIIENFTINGTFSKDGIHNPGKNYLKRKYYLV